MKRTINWALCCIVCAVFIPSQTTAQSNDTLVAFVADATVPEEARREALEQRIRMKIPAFPSPEDIGHWAGQADDVRRRFREDIVLRGVPDAWRDHEVQVEWTEEIETGHGYRIRKFRYEALPGFWVPSLLYEPNEVDGQVPAVLNVNGHVGEPGKASDYEQIRCINLAKRGMIAMHPEWISCGELFSPAYSHSNLAYLDLVGISGLSVFYYSLERALDVLLDDPRTDPDRVAMTGLSGGGWQTTVFSAIDERVKLIVPNAGHSGVSIRIDDLRNMGDLEQMPVDLLTVADYSHLTALFAPRPALLIFNAKDDCCFTAADALPTVYDPVKPIYEALGRADDFQFYINEDPGTHNYERDNRLQFYRFLESHFLPADERTPDEIPSDDELLDAAQLKVGLPEDNATFQSLAMSHAEDLHRPVYDSIADAATALREVTRWPDLAVQAEFVSTTKYDGGRAAAIHFNTAYGPFFGLLAETAPTPLSTVIHVSDAPIPEQLQEIRELAAEHGRVLAIEPLFLGGNRPGGSNAWQLAMALQSAGERLLGIQAAQIAGVARWLRETQGADSRQLVADGPQSTTTALIAAVGDSDAVQRVTLRDGLDSTLEPVREAWSWNDYQPLFCFGLYPAFDIEELENFIIDIGNFVEWVDDPSDGTVP